VTVFDFCVRLLLYQCVVAEVQHFIWLSVGAGTMYSCLIHTGNFHWCSFLKIHIKGSLSNLPYIFLSKTCIVQLTIKKKLNPEEMLKWKLRKQNKSLICINFMIIRILMKVIIMSVWLRIMSQYGTPPVLTSVFKWT